MLSGVRPCQRAPSSGRRAKLAPLAVLGAALSLNLLGCPAPAPGTAQPGNLPAYSGHATDLFDDVIEPAAVGLELDQGSPPGADATLRERTQVADSVLRLKMVSYTSKNEDTGTTYSITLRAVEVLAGKPQVADLTVVVGKDNPSAGLLKSRADGLVQKQVPFVGFVRAFAQPDGDAETHFHLSPDSADVVKAVRDAAAQQELR